ncbi:MAG TPA: hypothetical protein VF522_14285 [Ramlibacter sp.]|uniref:hypothetical protein n=1 Tax=Ramlibacter sp. TaxID=1917967 RepID=UPI002ED2A255
MKTRLRSTVAAVMLLGPLAATLVAEPAAAQQRAVVATPQIANMTLNSDEGLSPGATLRFQLSATPNARRASVTLGNSRISVPLRQQTRGNYTGSYIVRRSDRIDPTQLMTARVQFGERSYSRQFNYPASFQALAMGGAPAAPQDTIERFVMRPMGRLEAGRELRFRLVGKPGGDAWMDIPGVIRGIDLTEVRPGVYEGNYTIRRRDNLGAFDGAIATLKHGDLRATQRVDVRGGDREFGGPARDERAPQISEMTPGNGDRVTERNNTRISARLSDEGTGIDPQSVRLRLNGRDVTADARVNEDRVVFRDDLDPGRYTAELTVRDRAGNSSTKAWTFDVTGERNVGTGPLPLEVTSHSNNMVVDANGNLAIRGRTAPYATVRVQVDSVANVAGLLGVSQPVLDQTVQADREGRFGVTANPRGSVIPGTRYDVRVTSNSGSQTAEERLTLIQRQG